MKTSTLTTDTRAPGLAGRFVRLSAAVAVVALLLLALVATAAAAVTPRGAAPAGAADAVLVAPTDFTSADELIALVGARGARAALVLLPRTVLAYVPASAAAGLRADGFAVLRAADPPRSAPSLQAGQALALLRQLESPQPYATAAPVVDDLPGLGDDLLRLQQPSAAEPAADLLRVTSAGASPRGLPRANEPAAFAAGSVAVSVIFVESNGGIDANSENWSNEDAARPGDRRAAVTAQILTALAWWQARNAGAGLVFTLPAPGSLGAPQTVASAYEPIKRAGASDALWRHAIMEHLGFAAAIDDDPPPETAYDDAVRNASGTDWAFSVYVVDSLNDADGAFRDLLFAYTFDLFGPYMTLTYDNDGYGPGNFDAVMAHEMGHVFGALDEYASKNPSYPSTGDLFSGYLWVQNRNAVNGGTTDYPCIMRGGDEGLDAFANGDFDCVSTRGQVGWRDANHNGVADVVDTAPALTDGPQSFAGGAVSVTGSVREVPWPHGSNAKGQAFNHDISILTPQAVQFSVDGGGWQPAAAADGAFDEPIEQLTLTTGGLTNGHHTLELSATTGSSTTLTRDIWAGPVPVTLALTATRKTITIGSKVGVTVTASSGSWPVPFLTGVTVGPQGGVAFKTLAVDRLGSWTGTVAPRFSADLVAGFETSGQYVGPAVSPPVRVGVRPVLTVRLGDISVKRGNAVAVSGHFKPQRAGVKLALQIAGNGSSTWKTIKATTTAADGDFTFKYRATKRGVIRLRVRFAGDDRNLAASKAAPLLTVK